MADRDQAIRKAAERHELGESAVGALWDALVRGGGRQAQFSHPELGGMGQWSSGMVQIGDMFNDGLKAKVAAVCADLASLAARSENRCDPETSQSEHQKQGNGSRDDDLVRTKRADWWPPHLGRPASAGSQNTTRYAYFPEPRRLAIEADGRVTIYDTAHHRIGGVSQQQSRGQDLAFTSQEGTVDLEQLEVVEG